MKKIGIFFVGVGLAFFMNFSQEKPTAHDILDKIDQNMVYKTAYAESDMVITIKKIDFLN